MKSIRVQRSGWNHQAAMEGPFWYFKRNMVYKASIMVIICLITIGIGIIPVWIYCGYRANSDFYKYLKKSNAFVQIKSADRI